MFDGVPKSLPALAYADKVQRKAAKVGFDWPDVQGALPKIAEEANELLDAVAGEQASEVADELGDLLFAVVNVARHLGVDPELALRAATAKVPRHGFEQVEATGAGTRDRPRTRPASTALDTLWDEVKQRRGPPG